MKKILLILLLIPTLIQAEELGLICDGETTEYDSISKQKTSKKSSKNIIITDTYLSYEGLKYLDDNFDTDRKTEFIAHYEGPFTSTEIRIDRYTGKIVATHNWDKKIQGKDKKGFRIVTFQGICRKKEKAF